MQSFFGMTTDRQRLRAYFRGLRRQLMTKDREAAVNQAVGGWLKTHAFGCVGFYAPMAGEPDIRPAVWEAVRSGRIGAAAYPVVDDKKARRMHYVQVTETTPLRPGAFGIEEPEEGLFVVPDVIFAPCAAVTPDGYRLGNGGGFFDVWLAEQADGRVTTVAVAAEGLVTADFVPQSHDRPFQWLTTEAGVRRALPIIRNSKSAPGAAVKQKTEKL